MPKTTTKEERVVIPPPNLQVVEFHIIGTAPYVQHKFSQKARETMKGNQAAGPKAKNKRNREAKDFAALYKGAQHISEAGWVGIPASAFRSAMIDACRLVGFKMTVAKISVFVLHDSIDKDDGTPLVKITKGKPKQHEATVRLETGVADVRVRPMWREWECKLKIQFDGDQFTTADVSNLLMRAGMQVGVGEGRPYSKKSHGQGWGTFRLGGE